MFREKYQGVKAPKGVDEAKFDAVVAAEISQQHAPASRHIVQYVAQFQILKALCMGSNMSLASFFNPILLCLLYQCNYECNV